MTFAELAIGERFTFDPWSLDWLSAMGPQIKTGEEECTDALTGERTTGCGPDTVVEQE